MPARLDAQAQDFEAEFKKLISSKLESSAAINETVRNIINDVRVRGDKALIELSQKHDNIDLAANGIKVTATEIDQALAETDPEIIAALEFAAQRISDHHSRHKPADEHYTDSSGVELGQRWTPVDAAGLYVPGGTAAYPSSVLMNAIPAKVAGVKRLAMVTPMPYGKVNPATLAAAKIAGIDEIYRIGGAQAIAALAHGTETIAPVSVIVGPGNAYVAAAKKQLYGIVGIDMIAGPSEILIIADNNNNPEWIAIDLLAQAEHDPSARAILITDNSKFAAQVEKAIAKQLETMSRAEMARKSWEDYGAIIIVKNLENAIPIANNIATEHLEIATEEPEILGNKITNAGAIFLGRYTPEAIGDYVAGTNHVLPTARSARFSSALGVLDFMKRTSLIKCTKESLQAIAPAAITLSKAEGLTAHTKSMTIRLKK